MSSLILPCHKWFDYIFTDFPLAVVFQEVQNGHEWFDYIFMDFPLAVVLQEVQSMKPLSQLIRHLLNL